MLIIVLLAVIQINIITAPRKQTPKQSDAIIVLGCSLWGDQPSPLLVYRLERALDLYRQGYGSKIIVSGSQGPDEWVTEAFAMKKYLVENGVPAEIVLKEENSFSTYENLLFSKEIMDQEGLESAVVVTNNFHLHRSLMIADRLNITISGGAAKNYPNLALNIKYHLREVVAYIKDFIFSY